MEIDEKKIAERFQSCNFSEPVYHKSMTDLDRRTKYETEYDKLVHAQQESLECLVHHYGQWIDCISRFRRSIWSHSGLFLYYLWRMLRRSPNLCFVRVRLVFLR